MSHWNHRVISEPDPDELSETGRMFAIHEVYYEDDGTVRNWTAEPVPIFGEKLEDLTWVLDRMSEALEKPVLNIEDLPGGLEEVGGTVRRICNALVRLFDRINGTADREAAVDREIRNGRTRRS